MGLSGWRAAETTLTQQQAKDRGYTLQFSDAQQKQENQIAAVRSFIAQGVDAILMAPVVATGWGQVAGFATGGCEDKWNGSTMFLTAVDAKRNVTAYTGLDWNTMTLRKLKPVRLPRWTGPTTAIY